MQFRGKISTKRKLGYRDSCERERERQTDRQCKEKILCVQLVFCPPKAEDMEHVVTECGRLGL